MSGRPKINITESLDELKKMLKKQPRILEYNKVLALYLLKSGQAQTIREVAKLLNKGEASIHRWMAQYKNGGLDNFLKNRQTVGRPKKFSVETAARVKKELEDEEGFCNYQEIYLWVNLILDIPASYLTVYNLVKQELKSKLKVPRPRHSKQQKNAVKQFKDNLGNRIKALLHEASGQLKQYSKVSFWCSDETRLGLHTLTSKKITLSGVKPIGVQQWKYDYFWLYGAVEPSTGRSFFLNFLI